VDGTNEKDKGKVTAKKEQRGNEDAMAETKAYGEKRVRAAD
jgi:hypothetical protein